MGEEYTLNVAPEIASRARRVASQTHRRPEEVLSEWLHYAPMEPLARVLSHTEARLLQNINLGFSEQEWTRYHALVAKRRDETLTPNERQELVALSNRLEQANAHRIANLIELAKLRDTSLETLMRELGLTAAAYMSDQCFGIRRME